MKNSGRCLVFTVALMSGAAAALAQTQPAQVDPLCGAYTLYVGLKALDVDPGRFDDFRNRLGQVTPAGYSLGELAEAAESYGLRTLGVQTTVENLERRPGRFTCIAIINRNHFVNVADVKDGIVSIIDPPREYQLPEATFRSQWDGTALLLSPEPLLSEEELPRPGGRFWLVAGAFGLAGLLVLGLVWHARAKSAPPP